MQYVSIERYAFFFFLLFYCMFYHVTVCFGIWGGGRRLFGNCMICWVAELLSQYPVRILTVIYQ